jgi:dTDP-glucose 4,6-dehydratase
VIQIGSDEEYTPILSGSFEESGKLSPKNPYATSKASASLLYQAYFETYKLPIIITRSTNNYGLYQHPEKFVAETKIYALLNRKIPVYGTGRNIREGIFVEDNCEAIDLVLHKGRVGEIYNITGKQELENIEVVKTILKL